MTDNFLWLLNWFRNHCDGDWEHGSGVHIETLDNEVVPEINTTS